jgi:thioredoxin 1
MFRGMTYTTIEKTVVKPMSAFIPLPANVITEMSKENFVKLLVNNTGALVIKFGAEWCGPCKKIEPLVHEWFNKLPPSIITAVIDIDENFDIYALLKSKKQINGVPAILCYKKGNLTTIPDHIVVGTDENQINHFFEQCLQYA